MPEAPADRRRRDTHRKAANALLGRAAVLWLSVRGGRDPEATLRTRLLGPVSALAPDALRELAALDGIATHPAAAVPAALARRALSIPRERALALAA